MLVRARRIITMDPTIHHAEALGIRDGRVMAVGRPEDVEALAGPGTKRVDMRGAVCVPGFIDAHLHAISFGLTLGFLDLTPRSTDSVRAILELVRATAASRPSGGWIIGRGYDHNQLPEGRHPTRRELDEVAPDHPVALVHTSAHFTVVNSRATNVAGIPESHPPQESNARNGLRFSGLLEEAAQAAVAPFVYRRTTEETAAALRAAGEAFAKMGITTVHDAGVGRISDQEIGAYQLTRERGHLRQRCVLMVRLDQLRPASRPWALGTRTGFGDAWLKIGAAKIILDGSLLGGTAALDRSYPGTASSGGLLLDDAEFRAIVLALHQAGWQCAIHAVGDRAVRVAVEAIESAQTTFPRRDPRHRIEHCGLVTRQLIERIVAAGVIPVPQPVFVNRLGDGFLRVLGPDGTRYCYALRSFLDAGSLVPGSSDAPVASAAPLDGIQSAVLRRTHSGSDFHPEESVSPADALRMYTRFSAYAGFDENHLGVLRPGACADFVMLGDDPLVADPEAIRDIEVLLTCVDGRPTFER